ncbi:YqeG family HAD IIIA-type phosphatase [Ruminiclostridium cellobioparum]|jgi:HAD superfamily phosphatase (TIGR01668 family)|uniref:YqeG family HAD IIIA-type phosphatase n=1 Tax=Ruminiclostridium cellobioparum TaxID=29355 RepID=UPI0004864EDD|nr:YqeG family HAD IIIA-type phosphatase [Ruminiclostridium cellobioparum]
MIEKYYPDLYYDSIRHIDLDMLEKKGIKGFILDIDNTLVPMHSKDADQNAITWIGELKKRGFKVCILSNAARKRVIRFNREIAVTAIHRAYKPSGRAFLKAADVLELEPESIAVVGDQIFTDIHGGNKANMLTILVKPIDKREILYVRVKRWPEKLILARYMKKLEHQLKRRELWKKNRLAMEKARYKK